jgi:transcription-repair coupling factor (superfamily II helicase)
MNINQLLESYSKAEHLQKMADILKLDGKKRLRLRGLLGSQTAFIVVTLYQLTQRPILIIADDKEEAAYLQNDISTILLKGEALFFPDSYRRPKGFDKLNRNNVLQRTETVSKLVGRATHLPIIITYPEAIFEKVVAPKSLESSAIKVKVGERLDVKFLVEVLIDYGFDFVDFVYEPGQFSVRGGIIDIYSYGNQFPYRVELFDEEVESIRTFDPTSQLSTQRISFVTIVPNVNTQFEQEQKADIFDVLPEDTLVWIHDVALLLDRIQDCVDASANFDAQSKSNINISDAEEEAELMREKAFVYPKNVVESLSERTVFEFGFTQYFANSEIFDFHVAMQPPFQKNFEMLIKDLKENTIKGLSNYIFAENPKQIERFYSIFKDLKADVQWVAIEKTLHQGFVDLDVNAACYTDHQIFERFHRYKTRQGFDKNVVLKMKTLNELKPGDYVTHIDHGVGKYAGLDKITLQGKQQEAVKLIFEGNDILYVSIQSLHKISKYIGKDGNPPTVHKLGSNAWANIKRKTKKQIKELAFDLIQLYAKRRATEGYSFPPDGYLQNELEASFIYEDTPDQAKATEDVKADMMKPYPMDRLVCGDVGFGKTEVAIRAAFKAVADGKQVAILVPTTILALQHAQTFRNRLKEFGINVDYINRFRTSKEKTEIYKRLEEGKVDILIGTHAILNQKIKFKDLGLLVIDEEQKFGVGAKEKLRNMKVNVDTLTLTATPIPRTLQFSLMAARDLSVINTPPPNRQPIHTEIKTFDMELIKEAIENEVMRGGQVFFIHNRVQSLEDMASMLRGQMPNLDVAVAHGQMESDDLEKVLLDFIEGEHEVLVCTNIIETGLDIANANTIIINNAHHFGLSDLHQLRGRVGRSNRKAYCFLLTPPMSSLTNDARKRLQTIEQFAELGSGIHIAMRDLDIRGAGNLLGGEQSGFIVNMGYETYQKILNEAIQELKEDEYRDLFKDELEEKHEYVHEVTIETDDEMLIPDAYVSSIGERLGLYQKLDGMENESEIEKFKVELIDRFGPLPNAVENLFDALRLRWAARKLGFERISYKSKKLRCFFISNPDSPFYGSAYFQKLLQYIQHKTDHRFMLKQTASHLMLNCEEVKNIGAAQDILEELERAVEN